MEMLNDWQKLDERTKHKVFQVHKVAEIKETIKTHSAVERFFSFF